MGWIRRLGRSSGGGNGSISFHFSILAWRIPWTEEPSGLQGSQRVAMSHVHRVAESDMTVTITHKESVVVLRYGHKLFDTPLFK